MQDPVYAPGTNPWVLYLCCLQIANALYYNPALTLGILHKLGVATEIFNVWFGMLQQVKKSGMRANFRRYHFSLVFAWYYFLLVGLGLTETIVLLYLQRA